jgi:hypothetical protein
MLIFSITVFMRQTGTRPAELLPAKADWKELMKKIRHGKE